MATTTSFQTLAERVVTALGGPTNIRSVAHCATRLRFKLRDGAKVDDKTITDTDGVITLVKAGGQHQVVIGNEVADAYKAVLKVDGMASKAVKDAQDEEDDGPVEKGNLLNQFIDLVSSIFTPILWCLAGIALIKAFLAMFVTFGWIDDAGTNYLVLNALSDALIYFLPLFLAITSARKFKVNEYLALTVVSPLVYPSMVALASEEGPVRLFGIPLVTMNYSSTVLPAIITVWLTSILARRLEPILPASIRNFMVPLLCALIMVPVDLLTVGPATMLLASAISGAVAWVFSVAPWLAGAILGGTWQILVIFGLHWGLVPVMLNDFATIGYSLLAGPLAAGVLGQGAAVLAVAIRTRNAKRRMLATPAALSGIVAGVTEPAVYGVNLPLRIPFYIGCIGGVVGGAIMGIGEAAYSSMVLPSLLSIPALLGHGSFVLALVGIGVSMVIGFVGTFLYLPSIERKEEAAGAAATPVNTAAADATTGTVAEEAPAHSVAVPAGTTAVLLPVKGEVIPLDQVNDKVFASGSMGTGIAIIPTDGTVIAPVSGKIIAAPKSGHAFGIKTDDGIEVLVHVGIDTVSMKGAGFSTHVAAGDIVQAGDPLVTADLQAITDAGFDTTTILVVTNAAKLTDVRPVAPTMASLAGEAGLLVTR